jgi:transmembrane sensor
MKRKTPNNTALQQATEWFVQLDASEVTDTTKTAFFSWLDKDVANQSAYIEIEKLWGQLEITRHLPLEASPRTLDWLSRLLDSRGALGAFVTATVVLGLVTLFYMVPAQPNEYQYATAVGERGDFRLEDGSLLQLNTDSLVTVRMEESQRLLTLQKGEVYFDIAHNANRPLVVQTNDGAVRVLGTRFNIHKKDSGTVVSVIEGLVAVASGAQASQMSGPDFEPEYTLAANQQTQLTKNQLVPKPIEISSQNVLAWRRGKLIYEGSTLSEVVHDLNRYFPGTIRLEDPTLGALEIVGVLNLRNRSATLAALEATFGVQVVEVSEQLTLIQPRQSASPQTID